MQTHKQLCQSEQRRGGIASLEVVRTYNVVSGNDFSYWQPSYVRYQLKEGAAVYNFVKSIENELELATSFLAFLDELPAGTYHTGGITAYTNKAERRKSRK